ncbi:MAG: dTDP-glucose 4,6-dehydratase [Deltaproteobacteria bacterium]|nr:dTDP-glucose 4,6-dehydratase [Deltaproteobacteria bacterium]
MKGKTILVTGGCGFIGSNFIYHVLSARPTWRILNFDALTYSGNLVNFKELSSESASRHTFVHGDIRYGNVVDQLFADHEVDGIIHFAAESHVDRSILGPEAFVDTNVVGTFRILDASLRHWQRRGKPKDFRFVHVSTDEVYGSLGSEGFFREETPYDPSSPYSASKAASDHFVKAYFRTYGLPTIVTNCSNNYGPYQFPEKLIPLIILNILEAKALPIYGDGKNIRDWLYVIDHCNALVKVLEDGKPGESYNIGGEAERENIQVVHLLCDLLDARLRREGRGPSRRLIQFVMDRPGHDRRYAIDAGKLRSELGWSPKHSFEAGLELTVDWYLAHPNWIASVQSGEYRRWIDLNYESRDRNDLATS